MPQTLWSSFCVPTVKMPLFSPGSVYILEINKQKCPEWDEKMRLHIKILISPFELSPSGFLSVPWWLLFSTKLVSVPPLLPLHPHFLMFSESRALFFIRRSRANRPSFLLRRQISSNSLPFTFLLQSDVLFAELLYHSYPHISTV